MTEQWRSIPRYDGLYEVSDLGRVRSMTMRRGTARVSRAVPLILKPKISRTGYAALAFSVDTRHGYELVHRLVLEAFVGKCPDGFEAAHLDGHRANNVLTNLQWKSPQDNAADKIRHGTVYEGVAHHFSKLTPADVVAIREAFHSRTLTIPALAARYGIRQSAISRVVWGDSWKSVPMPSRVRERVRKSAEYLQWKQQQRRAA